MPVSLAYVLVILIWSTTPLAIQWSTLGAGFAFAVMARMIIGLLLALALIAAWRIGFPLHRRARLSYFSGGLGMFGAMTCTYWGAQYIPSGLIAVLFGLVPLVTSVLAALWLGERSLTPLKVIGLLLGLAGLALIFLPAANPVAVARSPHVLAGLSILFLGMLIYSSSLVALKRLNDDSPPLATTAGTLLVALPLFCLSWWWSDGEARAFAPDRTWAAILYLGVFGSVIGFALYYFVIKHMEAGKVALISLLNPVFALLLGHLLNGERIPPEVWAGILLIGSGLVLHQWPMITALMGRRTISEEGRG